MTSTRQAFRRELQYPREALLAVFVGRLDVHRKGLDVLVRGIADAPAWHLALVGPRFRGVERLERMIAVSASATESISLGSVTAHSFGRAWVRRICSH